MLSSKVMHRKLLAQAWLTVRRGDPAGTAVYVCTQLLAVTWELPKDLKKSSVKPGIDPGVTPRV